MRAPLSPTTLFRLALYGGGLALATSLGAQVTFYSGASSHANWLTAAGGAPLTLNFEALPAGTLASDPSFVTYAATANVVFQPLVAGKYPKIDVNNGGIGTDGPNWLGNFDSQGFTSDNSFKFTFNTPVRAFGFYDVGTNDGFTVYVFSTGLTLLNSFDTTEQPGTPLFWGFIANQDIGKVEIQPRSPVGNGYIGIDALTTVAVPEPAFTGLALAVTALVCVRVRRQSMCAG
jgi:hypothetical protein